MIIAAHTPIVGVTDSVGWRDGVGDLSTESVAMGYPFVPSSGFSVSKLGTHLAGNTATAMYGTWTYSATTHRVTWADGSSFKPEPGAGPAWFGFSAASYSYGTSFVAVDPPVCILRTVGVHIEPEDASSYDDQIQTHRFGRTRGTRAVNPDLNGVSSWKITAWLDVSDQATGAIQYVFGPGAMIVVPPNSSGRYSSSNPTGWVEGYLSAIDSVQMDADDDDRMIVIFRIGRA